MERQTERKMPARLRLKVTIAVAVLAVIVLVVFYVMMLSKIPNMYLLTNLSLAFFILIMIFLTLWTLCALEKCSRIATIIIRCYSAIIVAGVLFFIILLGLIISDARTSDAEADCIIVLGAGLRNDAPSLILRTRLNRALEYLETREGIPVVVSGGLGEGETITEAEAMQQYLIARGVDESLIWKEELSTRTQENIGYSLELIHERGLDLDSITVAIVTNDFHIYRAKHIAEKEGVEAVGVAAGTPSLYLRIIYFSREAFALGAELVFGQKIW